MTHLELYSSSIASGTTLIQVNAVQSNIYPLASNGFLVQALRQVASVVTIGSGAIRAQLQSPTLRSQPFVDMVPVNRSTGAESPVRFADFTSAPLQVSSNEELDAFAAQNSGSSGFVNVIVMFTDGPIRPAASNNAITVHATATTTVTAHAWSAVTFTLDTSLDPGTYSVVGMRAYSATGIAARLIPNSGGQTYRPGVPMVQAYDTTDFKYARYGMMGQLITFSTTALPQVELYCSSADTAEELWLDLVQTSSQVTG